jgi:hypothetical protein
MTETEWLAATDPMTMLAFLRGRASDRKWRLFACACCRRVWEHFPDPANRDLVVAVEDNPDVTGVRNPVRTAAIIASSAGERMNNGTPAYWAAKYLGRGFYKVTAQESTAIVVSKVLGVFDPEYGRAADQVAYRFDPRQRDDEPIRLPAPVPAAVAKEAVAQTVLVRDLFGNPLRPVTIDPNWITSTTVSLAEGIYQDRAFDRLPILADALQDAGCENADVLGHCRGEGPHVRGCWVVDLVLGKE